MDKNKFYITTPIYYVNDKPHIGHAYATVSADVLARYHRFLGHEVHFLTGTDEHGSKVAESAAKAGQTPQEFCDITSAAFAMAWDRLDISNNDFIRTTEERHKIGVTYILNRLKEVGAIYESEYEGLYCSGCEKFITEKDLVNGECPDHKRKPELIKEKNYFFKLSNYLKQVERLIDEEKIKIHPQIRRKEVLGLFKQELNDFSVSREHVKWGIPVPFDASQVTYVWVDALSNYITALGYGQADDANFKRFWPADLHVLGKDILKFHCVFWPAMLIAADIEVPKNIFITGYFTINGQKMSKTIGNIIDPNELVSQFGTDPTRYLLLSQFPFGADGDIKAENFVLQYNSDLANGIGNLTSRVLAMAEKYFEGVVPDKDNELKRQVEEIWQGYQAGLGNFQVDKAIEGIKKLVSLADGYIDKNKPWELAKTDQRKLAKVIYNLLEVIRHLGLLVYPIMPETAVKILATLGKDDFTNYHLADLSHWGLLGPGTKVSKSEALFPRIQ